MRQWTNDHGIHWCYHVPYHLESYGLIERWNGLLKTQLHCQLGVSSIKGWDRFLKKAEYVLNQYTIYYTIPFIARIHWFRN